MYKENAKVLSKGLTVLSITLLISLTGCFKKNTPVATSSSSQSGQTSEYQKKGGTIKFDEDAEEFYLEDDHEDNIFENEGKLPEAQELEFEEIELDEEGRGAEIIRFDFDKTSIKPEEKIKVEHNAQSTKKALHECPEAEVICDGHACKITRSEAYNHAISQERAEEIKKAYVKGGIEASKVKAVGHGATKLITDAPGKEAQSPNRRVETKVIRTT